MAKASKELMEALHGLLAQHFMDRLQQDSADGIPTDAATYGVIKGFLKDNEITADLADGDALDKLREKFAAQRASAKVLSLAKSDKQEELKAQEG